MSDDITTPAVTEPQVASVTEPVVSVMEPLAAETLAEPVPASVPETEVVAAPVAQIEAVAPIDPIAVTAPVVVTSVVPEIPAVRAAPREKVVEPLPFILAKKTPVAVVVVETEVARLLQKLVTDAEPVTWSSLPSTLTKAMELAEQVYGLTGVQKRQLVIDALTQLVRTVDKEAGISIADPVFEAMLPSLVDHFVAVSKDGLSINVSPPSPAGCFAFLCCSK